MHKITNEVTKKGDNQMEFKDRNPQFPGRVRLTPVSGQTNVYDMTLEDGAGTTAYPDRTYSH